MGITTSSSNGKFLRDNHSFIVNTMQNNLSNDYAKLK